MKPASTEQGFTRVDPSALRFVVDELKEVETLLYVILMQKWRQTMKIYVATEGCYSDYHVVAVFSSEAKAKEFGRASRDNYDWLEFELDDPKDSWAKKQGLKPFRVTFQRGDNCTVTDGWRDAFNSNVYECKNKYFPDDILYTECWARDKKHAIKIAADRRAEYLVNCKP